MQQGHTLINVSLVMNIQTHKLQKLLMIIAHIYFKIVILSIRIRKQVYEIFIIYLITFKTPNFNLITTCEKMQLILRFDVVFTYHHVMHNISSLVHDPKFFHIKQMLHGAKP